MTDMTIASPQMSRSYRQMILRRFLSHRKVATAVLMESYISFLGYGIQPPMASWGNMLANAQGYFDTVPFLAILPGLLITLTVMGFNFLGDGLRDAFDARLNLDT